ncbi:ubiquinone biosynthesis protein UbiA [Lacihabitans sp. CCS-44]|uniref:UbiA family prenyltransferase n=1 Tax=Lacihabitans sp. CCS-44 TaxID=2487331 RepID=UPI0020CF31A1|nr:UbiA family prenyltransferase [Lacihabitans sp. CCS-44]MCP9754055.1 ubiquinone biosynthesis protein UbiA [Lacihabitans sp. CCS-44]
MTKKDIFLHLRFPFSLFLMPIYWLAISQQVESDFVNNFWIFVILHIFIYPASNAFNSYFDKDEGSIGGLKNPPKVDINLWYAANLFDAVGVILSIILVGTWFGILVLFYVAVSRLYSHPSFRLKKFAVLSWLIVGLFQGALVFMMVYTFGQNMAIQDFFEAKNTANAPLWLGSLFSALILWAVYPITQVYQHEEDSKNGDQTMSILLGIRGTFVFCMSFFATAIFSAFFFLEQKDFIRFLAFSLPIAIFMNWWFLKVWKDQTMANFKYTMILNLLASVLLNICFLTMIL